MDAQKTRAILANNVRRLIAKEQTSVRAWALARELDVKLIDRLVKAENAVTLDKLAEIAEACGLQPWQLLIEDFDPVEPPSMPISEEERKTIQRLRRILDAS